MAEEYRDFNEALKDLGITESELWDLIHSGTLKAYRAGGVIKFKKSDIIAYQKSRGTEPTIVVSRKMLETMDNAPEGEEGMDTEVGLRPAGRSSEDDLATSEITIKEKAVEDDGGETAKVDASKSRRERASSRTGAATVSGRSKRLSQVLETEKKGNPIMNAVMILSLVVLVYAGLIQYGTLKNESWGDNAQVRVAIPAWIGKGLFDWGSEAFGMPSPATKLNEEKISIPYGEPTDAKKAEDQRKAFEDSKKPAETPAPVDTAKPAETPAPVEATPAATPAPAPVEKPAN
ncbi:MAG: helix-turn-helix domain-containing protein [Candidatus Brocadiia bacterium]